MNIFKVNSAKVARHNGKSTETMRRLKRNYEKWEQGLQDSPGLWPTYCKAYAYDKVVDWLQKNQQQ